MSNYFDLNLFGETALSGTRYVLFCYRKQPKVWLPLDECSGSAASIIKKLAEKGMRVVGKDAEARISEQLATLSSFEQEPLADRPGWNGDHFALPNGTVISPEGATAPIAIFKTRRTGYGIAGELADWQRLVAEPMTGQALPMFAVMMVFAAPLMGALNWPRSLIIEIVGAAGTGKSLTQRVAASASGKPEVPIGFGSLASDVQDHRIAHAGTAMFVDDPRLHLAGVPAAKAAGLVRDMVIGLTDGNGPPVAVLIAARESLVDLVGADSDVGKVISDRLITLNLGGARPWGVFDDVPDSYPSASAYANALFDATRMAYGAALSGLVARLVQARGRDPEAFAAKAQGYLERFRGRLNIDQDAGASVQEVDAFGLVSLAGYVAKRWKVLPSSWNCREAVESCYRDLRAGPPAPRPFINQLEDVAAAPDAIHLGIDPEPSVEAIAAAEVLVRWKKGYRELLIRTEAREKWVPAWRRRDPPAGLADFLVKDDNHWTVYRRLSKELRERVHVFRLPGGKEANS